MICRHICLRSTKFPAHTWLRSGPLFIAIHFTTARWALSVYVNKGKKKLKLDNIKEQKHNVLQGFIYNVNGGQLCSDLILTGESNIQQWSLVPTMHFLESSTALGWELHRPEAGVVCGKPQHFNIPIMLIWLWDFFFPWISADLILLFFPVTCVTLILRSTLMQCHYGLI